MSKINVLDSSIFNRIAAGEVVEKPASIVKELVENSLDAKATTINIDVYEGGIKRIRVSDNGCGIDKEDIKTAFLPHATSKISSIDDLDNIATLGFRGEALASVASVAQVEMLSKTENATEGNKITIEGGQFLSEIETGCPTGTSITVNNLFFNVPARQKFLRKAKSEEAEISNLVAKFILANPAVKIKYTADGKIVYQSTGDGDLKNAIGAIYGLETVENIVKVDKQTGELKLSGYIGKPEIAKANRTYQTLIVNGRYVVNYMISSAVQSSFDDFLMKGKFPFYVLNLSIPFENVDVNVHPNKLDVKFENSQAIYSLFSNAVFNALSNSNFSRFAETQNVQEEVKKPISTESFTGGSSFKHETPSTNVFSALKTADIKCDNLAFEQKENAFADILLNSLNKKQSIMSKAQYEQVEQNILFEENPNVIGVAFNTYIIIEKKDELLLIDQHAAHERQLYDNFQKQLNSNSVATQRLLVPYVLSVNYLENDFMSQNIEVFKNIGFDLEVFGNNTYKLNEIPTALSGINLRNYFDDILKNLSIFNSKPLAFLKETLSQKACKAATKGGDKLTDNEIKALLDRFDKEHNVLLCPHGRPIVIKITKNDIEKWFRRIV